MHSPDASGLVWFRRPPGAHLISSPPRRIQRLRALAVVPVFLTFRWCAGWLGGRAGGLFFRGARAGLFASENNLTLTHYQLRVY